MFARAAEGLPITEKEEKVNKVRSKMTKISNCLGWHILSHQINILETIELPLAIAYMKTMSNLKTFHLYR